MVVRLFTIACCLCFGACVCKDLIPNRLEAIELTSSNLRLSGYYYSGELDDAGTIGIAILYRNGAALNYYFSVPSNDTISEIESFFGSQEFASQTSDPPFGRGVFEISGSDITITSWDWGESCIATFVHTGYIVNDTTFVITEVEETNGGPTTEVDLTYRFVPLSPKPDSTSAFIDEG